MTTTATAVDLSAFTEDVLLAVLAYRQHLYSCDVRDEVERHAAMPESAVETERHRRALDAALDRRDEVTGPIRQELRRRRLAWERLCDEALGPEWRN
jgi:hypothetical protein